MALYIKYRGHSNTLADLTAADFTLDNRTGNFQKENNTTLNVNTPLGLLGGSVVAMAGPYTIKACDGDVDIAVGILINNVAGNAYENTPAVASNKGPYMHSMGAYEVDVYETVPENASATPFSEIEYTEGEFLYSSPNGLLTNDSAQDTRRAIAVVTKAPTGTNGRLGFNLLI